MALKQRIKAFLSRFSFRTGVIFLSICIFCYVVSFAQMLLPMSATTKTVVWIIFFGLAKVTQYMGLAIVGVGGWRRIKMYFRRRKLQR